MWALRNPIQAGKPVRGRTANPGPSLEAPAATKRLPSRPLHPDLIVITFSLVFPIFIYGIWTSQPPTLLPVLIFLAAVYGLYFWKRKAIVTRFEIARQRSALPTGASARALSAG